jgi:hypothetical protein
MFSPRVSPLSNPVAIPEPCGRLALSFAAPVVATPVEADGEFFATGRRRDRRRLLLDRLKAKGRPEGRPVCVYWRTRPFADQSPAASLVDETIVCCIHNLSRSEKVEVLQEHRLDSG